MDKKTSTMHGKIASIFDINVFNDEEGSIYITPSTYILNPDITEKISAVLREEAAERGVEYYITSVATSVGVLLSWSPSLRNAIPVFEDEEWSNTETLTYIVRKVR